jgi:hypothetical protein
MSQKDREEARQTYAILDGVRRAKAAWLLGNETINAQINGVGSTITLRLSNILSPKGRIETVGVRGIAWGKVEEELNEFDIFR